MLAPIRQGLEAAPLNIPSLLVKIPRIFLDAAAQLVKKSGGLLRSTHASRKECALRAQPGRKEAHPHSSPAPTRVERTGRTSAEHPHLSYTGTRAKRKGRSLHGRPWMVLCEVNQVAVSMGDTPCSFLQMSIAINMVTYVALWLAFKKITASCIAFLPLKSNLLLWSLNYSRICSVVK